jgi:hypothetical protein
MQAIKTIKNLAAMLVDLSKDLVFVCSGTPNDGHNIIYNN